MFTRRLPSATKNLKCPNRRCSTTTFDKSLLERYACPLTKTKLRYDQQNNELVCDELSIAYPIRNGIPYLLPQLGRQLPQTEKK
jgi:uncharacterized protein YbaR (Trm112 family)